MGISYILIIIIGMLLTTGIVIFIKDKLDNKHSLDDLVVDYYEDWLTETVDNNIESEEKVLDSIELNPNSIKENIHPRIEYFRTFMDLEEDREYYLDKFGYKINFDKLRNNYKSYIEKQNNIHKDLDSQLSIYDY